MGDSFTIMRETAVGWLTGRDPEALARNTGISYDPGSGGFSFRTLGRKVFLRWPDCTVTPGLEPWHELVLLHCLHHADGTPFWGTGIPLRAMKDGAVRGGGFDRKCERALEQLGRLPEGELTERCARLGGERVSGRGDFCARFVLLPCCPMTLQLWYLEDDLPASGRLLADASADHCLTVEDAVMLGEYLLDTLLRDPDG